MTEQNKDAVSVEKMVDGLREHWNWDESEGEVELYEAIKRKLEERPKVSRDDVMALFNYDIALRREEEKFIDKLTELGIEVEDTREVEDEEGG